MIIKFYCKKGHYSEIEEAKLIAEPQSHRYCYCGEKLSISNLEDIVEKDIYIRAEEYINKWLKEIGGDETLSLVQRNKNQSCYRIYKEILEKRGFKIK
jgi:hypothetical protein